MSEISICSYICDLQLNNPYKKKKQNTKTPKSINQMELNG